MAHDPVEPGTSSWAHVVGAADRRLFQRCRRAWDFGARARQNLEPTGPAPSVDLGGALREALAVYYFPGMWEWPRSLVEPLAREGLGKALRTRDAPDDAVELASTMLEHYFEWAPTVDRFTPVRVSADFVVEVPDPAAPGTDLRAADGRPIRFRGRIDLLVIDADDVYWIVTHHVPGPDFLAPDLVALDEPSVMACWAWERFFLGMEIGGTIANELRTSPGPKGPGVEQDVRAPSARPDRQMTTHRRMYARPTGRPAAGVEVVGDGRIRRTRTPRGRAELEAIAAGLAAEVLDMTDPAIAVYPSPTPEHCAACAFRGPCLALFEGGDPAPLLAAGYRTRPPDLEEGRLGGTTWSMNRGARPPTFPQR